jgi:hypothetical protein
MQYDVYGITAYEIPRGEGGRDRRGKNIADWFKFSAGYRWGTRIESYSPQPAPFSRIFQPEVETCTSVHFPEDLNLRLILKLWQPPLKHPLSVG